MTEWTQYELHSLNKSAPNLVRLSRDFQLLLEQSEESSDSLDEMQSLLGQVTTLAAAMNRMVEMIKVKSRLQPNDR